MPLWGFAVTMTLMSGIPHSYMTAHLPGVGGHIKVELEDFVVEEVPLYTPSGEGEHTYVWLEKRDLSTPEVLDALGRRLRIPASRFGHAGLKDRKALTRQWFSIEGVTPETVQALEGSQFQVIEAIRHTNKLRVGHLKGNRFEIRVRGIVPDATETIDAILKILLERGVPNYYGFQRFGNRGYAQLIGRDLLLGRHEDAARRILGFSAPTEGNPRVVNARDCFSEGDLAGALDSFPSSYRAERAMLQKLIRRPDQYETALRSMPSASRRLYSSAFQSYLFNLTLAERLRCVDGNPGRFVSGDLAFLHRNGAVFNVEEDTAEVDVRGATFEISPSGPILGRKMAQPKLRAAEMEEAVLEREGVGLEDVAPGLRQARMEGGRRPFRVPLEALGWRVEGTDLYMRFFLSKGSYATTLLREILKNDDPAVGFYEDGAAEKHDLWRPERGATTLKEGGRREPA